MHRKSERNEPRRAHPSTPTVNVATGNPAPIHPFPRNFQPHTGSRWNSRDICLPTISFFLPFPPFFEAYAEDCRLSRDFTLFSHSTIFLLHSPAPQPEAVSLVWTTARILFRRLRATFPARKSPLRFSPRKTAVHLPAVFLLEIYMYNDVSKLFRARCSGWVPTYPFDGTLELFQRTIWSKFSYVAIARRTWQREESRFTEMRKMQISITIYKNAIL